MGTEIERRFLVDENVWTVAQQQGQFKGVMCRQGYLCTDASRVVRVRIMGERAWLTIKGKTTGCSRAEYEYPIPLADAASMLTDMAQACIEKVRYTVHHDGMSWVVDVFGGANTGLVLAEIELATENTLFSRPAWVGEEVTQRAEYTNASLALHPFTRW